MARSITFPKLLHGYASVILILLTTRVLDLFQIPFILLRLSIPVGTDIENKFVG